MFCIVGYRVGVSSLTDYILKVGIFCWFVFKCRLGIFFWQCSISTRFSDGKITESSCNHCILVGYRVGVSSLTDYILKVGIFCWFVFKCRLGIFFLAMFYLHAVFRWENNRIIMQSLHAFSSKAVDSGPLYLQHGLMVLLFGHLIVWIVIKCKDHSE